MRRWVGSTQTGGRCGAPRRTQGTSSSHHPGAAQSVGLWLPVVSWNKQDFEHLSFQVSLGRVVWAGKGLGKQGCRRDNTSSVQPPPTFPVRKLRLREAESL